MEAVAAQCPQPPSASSQAGLSQANLSAGPSHNCSAAEEYIYQDFIALPWKVVVVLLLALFTLATTLSNAFVIATVYRTRKLHTPANYLIASLAVTDLLVSILVMPISMEGSRGWVQGRILWKLLEIRGAKSHLPHFLQDCS